jgi:hypothetical protein
MKGERIVNSLSDFTAEGLTEGIRNVHAEDVESQLTVRLDRLRVICCDVKGDGRGAPLRVGDADRPTSGRRWGRGPVLAGRRRRCTPRPSHSPSRCAPPAVTSPSHPRGKSVQWKSAASPVSLPGPRSPRIGLLVEGQEQPVGVEPRPTAAPAMSASVHPPCSGCQRMRRC